jgi:hypothetical protein
LVLHIAFNSMYNWWGLSDLKYFHTLFSCSYKVRYFNVWGWSIRQTCCSWSWIHGPLHFWAPVWSTLLLYGSYTLNLCDSIWFPVWLLHIMLWPFSVSRYSYVLPYVRMMLMDVHSSTSQKLT